MKLLYDLFSQLYEVQVFSELIHDRIIFQKSVFGFFYSYSLLLAIFFRGIDAWSSLFMLSIIRIFLSSIFWLILRVTLSMQYSWNSIAQQRRQQYYSALFKDLYSQECRRSIFWLLFSQLESPTYSASYLNWYKFRPFLVFNLPLIEIARTQFFVRWMDCNTPLLEYVLSCVFRFFDRIFQFTSLFIWSFCLGSGFVDSESAFSEPGTRS